jgi:putative signal transducing protein
MKLIYTNENRYLVHNIQNLVENADIEIMLKNEFAAGAAGDLVPHETWLELWVANDSDYDKAMQTIKSSFSASSDADWICRNCNEKNGASFEFCWSCQHSAPPPS